MNAAEWERLKTLFDEAISLPADERAEFLKKVRAENAEIAAQLNSLLEKQGTTLTANEPLVRFDNFLPMEKRFFRDGEMVIGRFRIVRFLGRGGMGEVYQAEDLQLGRVALKTLRAGGALDSDSLLRFRQEVQLARRVTSTNVCRIHDLFQVPGDRERSPCSFLTMELLPGVTLADRIEREGPLPMAQAESVALQLCTALQAIHDAGVIHRDFKSRNIMLVPRNGEPHAVVMDLGLARELEPSDGGDSGITKTGAVMGTPEYMAPEQFQGPEVTPAADIYALGIVLYELVTGIRPFRSATPLGAAVMRAKHPVAASSVRAGVPKHWDEVINRCLEFEPEARFQSASAVANALTNPQPSKLATESQGVNSAIGSGIASAKPTAAHLSRRLVLGFSLGGAATVAASWVGWPLIDSAMHPLPQKRFVALMAWPGTPDPNARAVLNGVLDAIAASLSRAEASVDQFLVLRPADVDNQVPREPRDAVSLLGVNLVLGASLKVTQDTWTLALKLLEAGTESALHEKRISSPVVDLPLMPERAALAAAALLQIRAIPPGSVVSALSQLSPVEWQAFAAAEELRKQPNDIGLDPAIAAYQKVLDAHPRFALGYASLATAYVRKYQLTREDALLLLARANADSAVRLDPQSPQSILSRALIDLYSGRIPEAMEALTRIQKLDPGNTQILMYQAKAFADLNRGSDEEACYRRILAERPNFWPAYNALGAMHHRWGQDDKAVVDFEKASSLAPQVARPLINAGSMYLLLKNRRADAEDAFRRSLQASPNELAYINLGNLAFSDKNYSKALDLYEKARDLSPRDHQIFRDIGDCYDALGRPSKVRENYTRAADLLEREVKINPRPGRQWMRLAFYDAKAGYREKAEADIRTGDKLGAPEVPAQFFKAQAEAALGRNEEALRLVLECIERGLSTVEVDFALDLNAVRADPRYRSRIAALKPAVSP